MEKKIKRLLLGAGGFASSNKEVYNFQYYKVTITPTLVYINKSLYKSQVAKIADLLTNDGEYDIDVSLYQFKNEPLNKSVKVGNARYPIYINWVNVTATTDVYGDLQLYRSGLMSFTQLRSKYSKGIHINGLTNSYELNLKIKSIIAVAKELSDEYPEGYKPSMINRLYPIETPVWEDVKTYFDPFTIDVYINKYQFTLVNNSLRNSKYIEYRLTDELPNITNINCVVNLDGKYIKDTSVKGISTKKVNNEYHLYINNYKLAAYNPNYSISCNKNGKLIPIIKDRAKDGYYILSRYCLASTGTYTPKEEKEIFEYLVKDTDSPILLRGGTDRVIEQIEDIFYYANKHLNSNSIFLRVEESQTYDNDALTALICELDLKNEGYANTTVSEHIDNLMINEGYVKAFLYNEGIILEDLDEDNLYKLHIRK